MLGKLNIPGASRKNLNGPNRYRSRRADTRCPILSNFRFAASCRPTPRDRSMKISEAALNSSTAGRRPSSTTRPASNACVFSSVARLTSTEPQISASCKDDGRYSDLLVVEQPVGQRRQDNSNRRFYGKDVFLNGAGSGCRRGEIGHYCATCLEGKIASQRRRGTLAEPPTVVSQPCGNRHSITATDLQDGLSGAVVQLRGKRSARVQDFYAVSVQPCFCARVRVTSLIRAMASSPFAGSIPSHANPQTYRPHPGLAHWSGFRIRCGQQE